MTLGTNWVSNADKKEKNYENVFRFFYELRDRSNHRWVKLFYVNVVFYFGSLMYWQGIKLLSPFTTKNAEEEKVNHEEHWRHPPRKVHDSVPPLWWWLSPQGRTTLSQGSKRGRPWHCSTWDRRPRLSPRDSLRESERRGSASQVWANVCEAISSWHHDFRFMCKDKPEMSWK